LINGNVSALVFFDATTRPHIIRLFVRSMVCDDWVFCLVTSSPSRQKPTSIVGVMPGVETGEMAVVEVVPGVETGEMAVVEVLGVEEEVLAEDPKPVLPKSRRVSTFKMRVPSLRYNRLSALRFIP